MNKRLFLLAIVFLVVSFSAIQALIAWRLFDSFSNNLRSETQLTFESQVHLLSDLIRTELLNENYREAQNRLTRAAARSPVVRIEAVPASGKSEVIFETSKVAPVVIVEVPIYFSEGGDTWGSLKFSLDNSSVEQTLNQLGTQLGLNQVVVLIGLALTLLAMSALFWRSGDVLEKRFIEILANSHAGTGRTWLEKMWQPVLEKFNSIASQYEAVGMLISSIEQDNQSNSRVAQIVHDLKSPLSAIKMASSKGGESEAMQLIRLATTRLEALIDSSLQTRKDQTGLGQNASTTNPTDLLGAIRNLLPELRSQGVFELNWICEDESRRYISNANLLEFQSIVGNLVRNSIEACSSQPKISVLLRQTVDFNYLIVSDNGSGMQQELINQLGSVPVSSGKESTRSAGTGSGLYSAFRTIRAWGGEVRVTSVLNEGTQIVLALPRST